MNMAERDKSLFEIFMAYGGKKVLNYLDADPDKNIPKILDWLTGTFSPQYHKRS